MVYMKSKKTNWKLLGVKKNFIQIYMLQHLST